MNRTVEIEFYKYQGTGNDFILIDNRDQKLTQPTRSQIAQWCDRKFGIGADGFLILNSHPDYDFEMKNYNSDGGECTMCGNGARTMIRFAKDLGIKNDTFHFLGCDGPHEAHFQDGDVAVKMKEVTDVTATPMGTLLNTGSPHLVVPQSDLMTSDIVSKGRALRNSPHFMPAGVNVNFVESIPSTSPPLHIYVRTYERGVEDETLSCGTGVVASAIAMTSESGSQRVKVQTRGGRLRVQFNRVSEHKITDIWLIGPAVKVFNGTLTQGES